MTEATASSPAIEQQIDSSSAVQQQIEWEREQDALNRRENDRLEDERKRQWEAEQAQLAEDRTYTRGIDDRDYGFAREKYGEDIRRWEMDMARDEARYQRREQVAEPYRQAGRAALGQLSQAAAQAGITLRPAGAMTAGLPGAPGAAGTPVSGPPPFLNPIPQPPMSAMVPARG